jgi:curli biogenesis system outer membrane secretion channel CsgG
VRWTVAVLDYENLNLLNTSHLDLIELLTAKTIETIKVSDRFDVVERQQLAKVLEELAIGSSIVASRQTRLKLGEITGARWMVFGSYQIIASQMRLDVRLVDVESGGVVNAVSQVTDNGSIDDWLTAVAEVTDRLFDIE